jgi:hypothetical protein
VKTAPDHPLLDCPAVRVGQPDPLALEHGDNGGMHIGCRIVEIGHSEIGPKRYLYEDVIQPWLVDACTAVPIRGDTGSLRSGGIA